MHPSIYLCTHWDFLFDGTRAPTEIRNTHGDFTLVRGVMHTHGSTATENGTFMNSET
jgi:hypothetical protein